MVQVEEQVKRVGIVGKLVKEERQTHLSHIKVKAQKTKPLHHPKPNNTIQLDTKIKAYFIMFIQAYSSSYTYRINHIDITMLFFCENVKRTFYCEFGKFIEMMFVN